MEPFDKLILLSSVETSAQGWHMMTVEEELARAVQIASASNAQEADNMRSASRTASDPQKVTSSVKEGASSSSSNAQEVTNRNASRTAVPSNSPSPVTESPDSVTVQRSPAFSLSGNSEEGKVKCDECGKSFSNKAKLHFHTKIIHRGERLPCKVADCEKTFGGYNTRENHMRMVHGSPMLRCKFEGCASEFYSSHGLNYHHHAHTK